MSDILFSLMSRAGAIVDRLECCEPGSATIHRILARIEFYEQSSADLTDAQAALTAHVSRRAADRAQVAVDRQVIGLAQASLSYSAAMAMWARQDAREAARRATDGAEIVRLRTERDECREIAAADLADLEVVLAEATTELVGLELRQARLAREAAETDHRRHYDPDHVGLVLAWSAAAEAAARAGARAL